VRWIFSRDRLLLIAKLGLLCYFVAATNPGSPARLQAIGIQAGLAVFVTVWATALFSMLLVAFSPSRATRIVWTVLFCGATLWVRSYELITAKHLGLEDFEQLLQLRPFVGDVLDTYQRFILIALGQSFIGVLAINLPPYSLPRLAWRDVATWARVTPVVPIFMIAAILYARGGQGSGGLPAQYNPLAFAGLLTLERLTERPLPPRAGVELPLSAAQELKDIVLVIDESIRGDLLDINHPGGIKTRLDRFSSETVNFGIAASATDCSAETNVTLRYGARRSTYLRDIYTRPSIWLYAQTAGYEPVYIDGQRYNGDLHNNMTAQERREINRFIQLSEFVKPADKDITIARIIRTVMRTPGRHFILVNKSGTHFPFEGKYPESHTVYAPTMRATFFSNETDPQGVAWQGQETPLERAKFLNSYKNAVEWNVGFFFQRLLAGLDLTDAVVVYTSDHGQDFHEDGRPGWRTHCDSGNAPPGEGIVPFVIITSQPELLARLRKAAEMNRGRISHFNVFPSLLLLMGYSGSDLLARDDFERTIFNDLTGNDMRFLSDYFVRFGRKPVWNSIEPSPESAR